MKCGACGNSVSENDKFCQNCGKRLQMSSNGISQNQISRNQMQSNGVSPNQVSKNTATVYPVNNSVPTESVMKSGKAGRDEVPRRNGKATVVVITVLVIIVLGLSGVIGYMAYDNYKEEKASSRKKSSTQDVLAEKEESHAVKNEATEEYVTDEDIDTVEIVRREDEEDTEGQRRVKREEIKSQDDYLFPSDRQYIDSYDLRGLNQTEVAYIRNEIYARHGYIFQTEPYKSYFEAQDWYIPNPEFDESCFNSIEQANKDFIIEYEISKGWR